MRWLHISSVVTLIGGAIFGRFVAAHATDMQNTQTKQALWEDMAAHFKPLVYAAVAALLVSGLYNILAHPGHSMKYHILLGVKLLLALHVFAVMLLGVQTECDATGAHDGGSGHFRPGDHRHIGVSAAEFLMWQPWL